MSASFDLSEADWVGVGVVGEPGSRTFYLQAGQGTSDVTLKVEKTQVAALAGFLTEILADLPEVGSTIASQPSSQGLREPFEAAWVVGAIQLRYDNVADRIVVIAEEIEGPLTETEQAERELLDDQARAVIGMTRAQAVALVSAASELLSGGRPPCPLCGRPMNPQGHSCPRTNGHHPD